MKGKIILCRCEDVTLEDVEESIERGYADVEEIKRYTGFGTGPCQGKECLSLVAQVVATHTDQDPAGVHPFTSRPPLAPTPLKHFAALAALDPGLAEPHPDSGAASGHGAGSRGDHGAGAAREPSPEDGPA